jgi:hypothetical protein
MKWLLFLGGALLAVFLAYSAAYPTFTYRFRLTLNVDTSRGLKSGSSEMTVRYRSYPAWVTLGNNTGEVTLTGEAVFVDLGPGEQGQPRNVVALLTIGRQGEVFDFYVVPERAFEPMLSSRQPYGKGPSIQAQISALPVGTRAELRGDQLPNLVTFSNPADPSTARTPNRVSPRKIALAR